jgi:hypothetical protein
MPYPNFQAYHTHCYEWYLGRDQSGTPQPGQCWDARLNPPGDIVQFRNLMTTGTPAGPNLPVWLTEFGVVRDYIVTLTPGPHQTPMPGPCGAVTPSDLEAQDLAAWTEWLEKTDWIERYAYFLPRGAPDAAFWPDDYTLSHLMYPEGCAFRNAGQVGRYSAVPAMQANPGQVNLTFDTFGTQQRFTDQTTLTPMANAIWDLRALWNTSVPTSTPIWARTPQHDYGGFGLASLSLQLPPDATPAPGYFAAGAINLVNGHNNGTADNPYQFSIYSALSGNGETEIIFPHLKHSAGWQALGYFANVGGAPVTVKVDYYAGSTGVLVATETIASVALNQAVPLPRYIVLPNGFDGWARASVVFSPSSYNALVGASALYRHNATPAATPPTGNYELGAIPAVPAKPVVYLPRARLLNATTTLRIVNVNNFSFWVDVEFYEANGFMCSDSYRVNAQRVLEVPVVSCGGSPTGYAVRVVSQNVPPIPIVAMLYEAHPGSSDFGSYVGPSDLGNPTYAPLVYRDHYGWFSMLHITNFHPAPESNTCQIAFYSNSLATPPPTPAPKVLSYGQSWIIDLSNSSDAPGVPPGFFGTAMVQCTWEEYAMVVAQSGPADWVGDRFGLVEAMAQKPLGTPTPTATPDPSSDYAFSGDVMDETTGQPVAGTNIRLYRLSGTEWQFMGSTTTGPNGRFRLRASGLPAGAVFRIVRQDLPGYTPIEVQDNPFFAATNAEEIVAISGLARGHYLNLHFLSRSGPNVTATPWPTRTP